MATSAVVTDELHVPVCTDLPYGARENETGITLETIILNVGYYRISNTSTDVRECYQKEACIGGYVVGGYCAAGYQGPCECMRDTIGMVGMAGVATHTLRERHTPFWFEALGV